MDHFRECVPCVRWRAQKQERLNTDFGMIEKKMMKKKIVCDVGSSTNMFKRKRYARKVSKFNVWFFERVKKNQKPP